MAKLILNPDEILEIVRQTLLDPERSPFPIPESVEIVEAQLKHGNASGEAVFTLADEDWEDATEGEPSTEPDASPVEI